MTFDTVIGMAEPLVGLHRRQIIWIGISPSKTGNPVNRSCSTASVPT
jgi:hypothetical protein